MFRRHIPFNQIAFATLVGVAGGVYIYKPMFEAARKPAAAPDQELKTEPEEQEQGADTPHAGAAGPSAH